MKNKQEILKKLALDFSKYDYYDHCDLYRYSKKKKTSEIFNGKTMKWQQVDFNIRELAVLWGDPEHDDIRMFFSKEPLMEKYLNLKPQEIRDIIRENDWQEHKRALEKQIKEYLIKGKSIPSKLFITVVGDCPDTSIARKIIPLQKNINAKDGTGQTALHRCAMSAGTGIIKTIKLLIKHGANINIKDKDGNRPVDCVIPEAWEGDTKNMNKVIELLTPIITKRGKNLVEQYLKLSMRLGDEDPTDKKEQEVVKRMDTIKKRFTEKDWDKLIHSVPVFMRPMVAEQKKKYLKNDKQ